MKVNEFRVGQIIKFNFVGEKQNGKILEIIEKENNLKVLGADGLNYRVYMNKKDSVFCYIVLK